MDGFDARKAQVLAGLRSDAPDKSPKGGLDAPCAALVHWLNAQRDVCTTSSCSGRVSLFAHAPGRAKGGRWAYISHERASAEEVAAAFAQTLAESSSAAAPQEAPPGDVVLRFEPFILTAECRTRDAGLQARCCAGVARASTCSPEPPRRFSLFRRSWWPQRSPPVSASPASSLPRGASSSRCAAPSAWRCAPLLYWLLPVASLHPP